MKKLFRSTHIAYRLRFSRDMPFLYGYAFAKSYAFNKGISFFSQATSKGTAVKIEL